MSQPILWNQPGLLYSSTPPVLWNGTVPDPTPPHKKPRRFPRLPAGNPETITNNTTAMSDTSFHYVLRPNQSNPGTWTTRAVFQPEYAQAQLVADVIADLAATGITLTAPQVEACGTAILRRVILAAQATRKTRGLFGLMDFAPSSGGVIPDTETPATPELLNVEFNTTLTEAGTALYVTGMTFARDAIEGVRAPNISAVLRFDDNMPYAYTPGAGFRIVGTGFGKKPNLATGSPNGVYAVPVGGGTDIRVTAYTKWTDTEIGGTWPSTLTGDYLVRVVTTYPEGLEQRSDETTMPMHP